MEDIINLEEWSVCSDCDMYTPPHWAYGHITNWCRKWAESVIKNREN